MYLILCDLFGVSISMYLNPRALQGDLKAKTRLVRSRASFYLLSLIIAGLAKLSATWGRGGEGWSGGTWGLVQALFDFKNSGFDDRVDGTFWSDLFDGKCRADVPICFKMEPTE